jgi:hypothetical protein
MINETTSAILNFKNRKLTIPYSGIEKQLLLVQFGFGVNSNVDDKVVLDLIESRVNVKLHDLFAVIAQLPDTAIILDIGSGNSLIDLAICLTFPEKNFKFILVDDSDTFKQIKNTLTKFYDEHNYKTYNNWSLVNTAIEQNRFVKENFIFKSPNDEWAESKVDLILSTASWGWHYPIDTYLDKVSNIIKDGGHIYINSVLNVDNAIDKLLLLCPIVLKKTLKEYQEPLAELEDNRVNSLIHNGRVSKKEFKYVFLGKVKDVQNS